MRQNSNTELIYSKIIYERESMKTVTSCFRAFFVVPLKFRARSGNVKTVRSCELLLFGKNIGK